MNVRVPNPCGYLLLTLAISLFGACGDDSDHTEPDGGSGTSSGGKGGKSGKGGSGGGGKGGAGGTGGGGSVTCGGQTCTVNMTLLTIAPGSKACCTADDKCGQPTTAGKCLLKNAPGTPDTSCPKITVMAAGMSFPQDGCCTPQGKCGGNYAIVEYGCVAREDVERDMGGPLTGIACGGDSGAADAGK
jgi:hypothetical protein